MGSNDYLALLLLAIVLGGGAYQAAAKEWGCFAGIISLILALTLPIASFIFWSLAMGKKWNKIFRAESSNKREKKTAATSNEEVNKQQVVYLSLLASMMAKIAKADGRVDEFEIKAAEKAFDKLELSEIQKHWCVLSFRNALRESYGVDYYATRMIEYGFSYELRAIAYEIIWDIACANGILTAYEKVILEGLEKWLNLLPGNYNWNYQKRVHTSKHEEQQEASYQNEFLANEYDILGCSPSATDEELKKAYRTLVKKFHPDILRAQGMPESFMKKANEHMARINAAWEKVKKARNIKG